jgi:hypothetical protein
MKKQYRFWLIGVVALVFVAAVAFVGRSSAAPERTLALQAPAFVQNSEEGSTVSDIGLHLSSEAGISAYMQTVNPIDLNLVRGEFRTIETETADYIIGSVPVSDHPEHFDVHVYVHTDGWILAYYLNDDVTGKIVDVKSRTISSTKLESVISLIAGTLGESVTGLKYYDFRYPNATNILMVAEDHENGRDFTISLPSDYGYSERSWAMINNLTRVDFYINGTVASRDWSGWDMGYGTIPSSQLLPGQTHAIELTGSSSPYGVLVITYSVP